MREISGITASNHYVTSLTHNTTYLVKVQARNEIGYGKSVSRNVTTLKAGQKIAQPEKKKFFSRCHHWFPHDVRETSEENSILITCHCPVLDSASDWLKQISLAAEPIRSTTQIWVLTRHQYRMSALVPQTIISRGNLLNDVAKCQLFSQSNW